MTTIAEDRLIALLEKMKTWIQFLDADEIPEWASNERVSKEMKEELAKE